MGLKIELVNQTAVKKEVYIIRLMKFKMPPQQFAFYLLVAISMFSGIYAYLVKPSHYLVNNDGTSEWEARMQPIRERLPKSVKEIGYVSDTEDIGSTIEEFLLTKYALIPIAVYRGADHEWIIGNFTKPDFREILNDQITDGYDLEYFGFGIYLVHRLRP